MDSDQFPFNYLFTFDFDSLPYYFYFSSNCKNNVAKLFVYLVLKYLTLIFNFNYTFFQNSISQCYWQKNCAIWYFIYSRSVMVQRLSIGRTNNSPPIIYSSFSKKNWYYTLPTFFSVCVCTVLLFFELYLISIFNTISNVIG